MITSIIIYALVALCAFALGAIANAKATKAEQDARPRDYLLTVSLGGKRRLHAKVSQVVKSGIISGDADLGDGRFIQLGVEVSEVRP